MRFPPDHPNDVTFSRVADSATLAACCGRWQQGQALAIDTEFFRERTFYPVLGLIQVADEQAIYLVDPLSIDDLEPFVRLLLDEQVVKVMHSASEDIEALHRCFDTVPSNLFDSQIAAALCGRGMSLGYRHLVDQLFDVDLPKGETRSDWLRRPLRPAQEAYAALDVAYLLPAWRQLKTQLESLGRLEWAREDVAELTDERRFVVDAEKAYVKIGSARQLNPGQLAALRELTSWREHWAREKDLPRSFVIRDVALAAVARHQPRNMHRLAGLEELNQGEVKRHGRRLLQLLHQAKQLAPNELPPRLQRPFDLAPHKKRVAQLRHQVVDIAEQLSLPPELLASRKLVESVARRFLSGEEQPLPRRLRGWRRQIIGEPLLEALRSW